MSMSMLRMVTVNISGHTNVGKTTIGVVIEKALAEAGFVVVPFDNHDGDVAMKREMHNDGTLLSAIDKTKIEVVIRFEEKNLPRRYR